MAPLGPWAATKGGARPNGAGDGSRRARVPGTSREEDPAASGGR